MERIEVRKVLEVKTFNAAGSAMKLCSYTVAGSSP